MAKPPTSPKPLPTSVRFTADERAEIERRAGNMSLSDYIRMRVLDRDNPPPQRRGKTPVKDHKALAQVLALLGMSRISNNLNQLARASNSGSLVLTPDLVSDLNEALRHIASMRRILLLALGLSEK